MSPAPVNFHTVAAAWGAPMGVSVSRFAHSAAIINATLALP